jgi:hypothetical protein
MIHYRLSTDLKKIIAISIEAGHKSGQLRRLPLGVLVPIGQLAHAWPHLLIRGAQQPDIRENKMDQTVTTHQGVSLSVSDSIKQ